MKKSKINKIGNIEVGFTFTITHCDGVVVNETVESITKWADGEVIVVCESCACYAPTDIDSYIVPEPPLFLHLPRYPLQHLVGDINYLGASLSDATEEQRAEYRAAYAALKAAGYFNK